MSLEQKFIPLYFGEEDEDLWQAFQEIKPEERIRFIKNMLRKTFQTEIKQQQHELTPNHFKLDDIVIEDLNEIIGNEEDEEVVSELIDQPEYSLEDLFREENALPKDPSSLNLNGLQYLLTHVIGEEEDEEVIHAIQTLEHGI